MLEQKVGDLRPEEEAGLSLYERACGLVERFLKVAPSKDTVARVAEATELTGMKVSASGPLSLATVVMIASIAASIALMLAGIVPFGYLVFANLLVAVLCFYIINYPVHMATVYRIKAGPDLVLSVLYMVIAMRSTPNLEKAVSFAASNLHGSVGKELRQLIWDITTKQSMKIDKALKDYSKKWGKEADEFTKAVDMIAGSLYYSDSKRNEMLDEAVNVVLSGSAERMNRYAREMTLPVSAISMLGIMLPILGLVLFPMLGIFLGEFVNQWFLAFGYNVLLPIVVFWFITSVLETRPMTFSAVDISEHPEADNSEKFRIRLGKRSYYLNSMAVAAAFLVASFAVTLWLIPIPLNHSLYSVALTAMLIAETAIALAIYSYGKSSGVNRIKKEIDAIESEFTEAIFHLGYKINRGVPLEKALEESSIELKDMKIRGLFERSLNNIKNLGMTFEDSLFDPKYGALRYYPSRLIKAVLKVVAESSKKGTAVAASAMLTIHTYLKGMHATQEKIDDTLSETTSSLDFMAYLLAPMMCGIVVALSQLIINILITISAKIQALTTVSGIVGFNPVETIINLKVAIGPEIMQMIIGVYMVELSMIFAYFITGIRKGFDMTETYDTAVKILLASALVYMAFIIGVGGVFGSIIEMLSTITV